MITNKNGVKQIIKEGVYERCSVITSSIITKCDECDKENIEGLHFDNSGGEYTPSTICIECIKKLFI